MESSDVRAHIPVLVNEVRELLQPERGGVFVDCTVGAGGHARMLLAGGATRVVGIDRDPEALTLARAALAPWGDRVTLVHADHRDIGAVLDAQGVAEVAGIVADLGVSSMQLDAEGRGFSFRRDEPLDMRMDRTHGETAAVRIDRAGEAELADVIHRFGEERRARRVARAIVTARRRGAIATTGQLADIVRRAVGRAPARRRPGRARRDRPGSIDPATRTFQAIRIWVNGELEGLDAFIRTAAGRLAHGGRIAIVAFHSLEDRVVKHTLRELSRGGGDVVVSILTKRPVVPGHAEVAANPRARSAKLRAAMRTRMGTDTHGYARTRTDTHG